jgi:hypothetical protein
MLSYVDDSTRLMAGPARWLVLRRRPSRDGEAPVVVDEWSEWRVEDASAAAVVVLRAASPRFRTYLMTRSERLNLVGEFGDCLVLSTERVREASLRERESLCDSGLVRKDQPVAAGLEPEGALGQAALLAIACSRTAITNASKLLM